MKESGNESENKVRLELVGEVRGLRKGSGLTLSKLRECACLLDVLASKCRTAGIEDPTLQEMCDAFLAELQVLGQGIEVRAVRNALAVGIEGDPSNITQRRNDFAEANRRHADTIESYENKAIDELITRLRPTQASKSIRAGGEVVKDVEVGTSTSIDAHIPAQPNSGNHEIAATEAISRIYSISEHAADVLRCLGRSREPLTDVDVEWLLLPSGEDSTKYLYYFKYTFQTSKNNYRIAVVGSAHDCEAVMAAGVVDDVVILSSAADAVREAQRLASTCSLIVKNPSKGTRQVCRFEPLDAEDTHNILHAAGVTPLTDLIILQVGFPRPDSKIGMIYEYVLNIELNIAEHYCYWYTPCLMHINSITLDWSRFPQRNRWRFFVQPFFGAEIAGTVGPTEDRYSLSLRGWITPGHGIAIIWQELDSS